MLFLQVCRASCDIMECRQLCPWAGIGAGPYYFFFQIQSYLYIFLFCCKVDIESIPRLTAICKLNQLLYLSTLAFLFFLKKRFYDSSGFWEKCPATACSNTASPGVLFTFSDTFYPMQHFSCDKYVLTYAHSKLQNSASLRVVKSSRVFKNRRSDLYQNVAKELVAFFSLTAIELFIFDFTMIGFWVPEGQYLTN